MREDKIVVVRIVLSNYRNWIEFIDKIRYENNIHGRTYKANYKSYQILRRVISEMDMKIDLDLNEGVIVCTRRDYEAGY
jgi:hypothetical protein